VLQARYAEVRQVIYRTVPGGQKSGRICSFLPPPCRQREAVQASQAVVRVPGAGALRYGVFWRESKVVTPSVVL